MTKYGRCNIHSLNFFKCKHIFKFVKCIFCIVLVFYLVGNLEVCIHHSHKLCIVCKHHAWNGSAVCNAATTDNAPFDFHFGFLRQNLLVLLIKMRAVKITQRLF